MSGKVIEAGRAALGGWFLRPYLQKLLGGSDWFQSITVWGLIVVVTAETFVGELGARGFISVDSFDTTVLYLQRAGEILAVLGVRRAALRRT